MAAVVWAGSRALVGLGGLVVEKEEERGRRLGVALALSWLVWEGGVRCEVCIRMFLVR